MTQKFGGEHTEKKLDIIEAYVKAYLLVMKNQDWATKFYIDAFAGSGYRHDETSGETLAGAVHRVLSVELPFDYYYLNDIKKKNIKTLREMVSNDFSNRNSIVYTECMDANQFVEKVQTKFSKNKNYRGIIFLDPFGMQVEWKTIQIIANTTGLDMFYLFPIGALNQQTSEKWKGENEKKGVSQAKQAAITRSLGNEDWKDIFYKETDPDLFNHTERIKNKKVKDIEDYVKGRFHDVFRGWVSEPFPIKNSKNVHLFSLFFAISNPSENAVKAAKRIMKHVQKNFEQ